MQTTISFSALQDMRRNYGRLSCQALRISSRPGPPGLVQLTLILPGGMRGTKEARVSEKPDSHAKYAELSTDDVSASFSTAMRPEELRARLERSVTIARQIHSIASAFSVSGSRPPLIRDIEPAPSVCESLSPNIDEDKDMSRHESSLRRNSSEPFIGTSGYISVPNKEENGATMIGSSLRSDLAVTSLTASDPVPSINGSTAPLTEQDEEREIALDLFCSVGGTISTGDNDSCPGFLSLQALCEASQQAQTLNERTLLQAIHANLNSFGTEANSLPIGAKSGDGRSRRPSVAVPAARAVSFDEFFHAFQAVPRLRGGRLRWAGTLGIDAVLARFLRRGDAFDGLKGLRNLGQEEAEAHANEVSTRLAAALPGLVRAGLMRLREKAERELLTDSQGQFNQKFISDTTVGRFGTLAQFYKGPEALIGVPNPQIFLGMQKEHCVRDNADQRFTSTNYNVETYPRLEWEIVVEPVDGKSYPHVPWDRSLWPPGSPWLGKHGREPVGVDELMQQPRVSAEVKRAGLRKEEVIATRLYSGPMFVLYNAALRQLPKRYFECLKGNMYETTIFTIASGVTKLSKAADVPTSRLLYRGLGCDLILPDQFRHEYAQSTVAITISTSGPEAASNAACSLAAYVEQDDSDPWKDAAFGSRPMRGERLTLRTPEACHGERSYVVEAQMVASADVSGSDVKLLVALPGSRQTIESGMLERLKRAILACLASDQANVKIQMDVVEEKPEGFRGGVELGFLSLSESRGTALRYGSMRGKRGTVFEVQVGRVDIGASIQFLSQYPEEMEFLMPPLSCLEVVGDPRLDYNESGVEVVVLQLRVNVNLKAQSVDELIGRRKLLHAAATKNLREELERGALEQTERFQLSLNRRNSGTLERLRGIEALPHCSGNGAVTFAGSTYATMGAPYLALSAGRVFFEVEVLEAPARATLGVGFAGTAYNGTARADVGDDALTWAIFSFDKARHNARAKPLTFKTRWFVPGTVLALAADLDNGRLLAAVQPPDTDDPQQQDHDPCNDKWEEVYSSSVTPGPDVGGGLFPILTGGWGASFRCNFGHFAMRIRPPETNYIPIAHVATSAHLEQHCNGQGVDTHGSTTKDESGEQILEGLNVSQKSLLERFDAVRGRHEAKTPEEYNDDRVYKDSLSEILATKVCAERKREVITDLLLAGAAPSQLTILKDAPPADFEFTGSEALGKECAGYSWRLIFSGWFRFVYSVKIPLETAPGLIALVWRAVLEAAVCRGDDASTSTCTVDVGGRPAPISTLFPVLRLEDAGLQSQRFENAVLGLTLAACDFTSALTTQSTQRTTTSHAAIWKLTDADFRKLEFSKQRTLQLASAVVSGRKSGTLKQVNALEVMSPSNGENLRNFVRRKGNASGRKDEFELGQLDPIDWGFVMAEAALAQWRELNVSRDSLDANGATGLAVGLGSVVSLTVLDLSDNHLQDTGIDAIGSALVSLSALARLELSNTDLGESGGSALARHLRSLSGLISLGLANNKLNWTGASAICCALASCCKTLVQLDLSTNCLGHAGGEAVASALKELHFVRAIKLCGQDIGSAVWQVLSPLIPRAESLTFDSGLVTVIAVPNESSSSQVQNASTDLESTVELIRQQALGPDGARRLANILNAGRIQLSNRLTCLELANNCILAEGVIALESALREMTALTRLGLATNSIGLAGACTLASGLRGLIRLQSLSLEGNGFSCLGWSALSDAIQNLTALTCLNGFDRFAELRLGDVTALEVAGKELAAAVAPLLFQNASTLSVLDISSNCINAIYRDMDVQGAATAACRLLKSFGVISALTIFRLSDNQLGSTGGLAVSEALSGLSLLTSLDLSRTVLGPDGAIKLANGLKRLTFLRSLRLAGNRIGADAVAKLRDALPAATALETLVLGGNELRTTGAETLAIWLKSLTRIKDLRVPENSFGPCGALALRDSLWRLSGLTYLDLHSNELGPLGGRHIMDGLTCHSSEAASVLPQGVNFVPLSTLIVRDNQFREEGGTAFAEGLWRITTLQSLNLAGNLLGLAGCRQVLTALVRLPILQDLDLSENALGTNCWDVLSERFGSLGSLRRLHLAANHVGCDGVVTLHAGLSRLSGLSMLDLSNAELGPEGGTMLCKYLPRLSALEELVLEANSLGPDGGHEVAKVAVELHGLQDLNLRENAMGSAGTLAVQKLLATRRQSLRVDLRWNGQSHKFGSASRKIVSAISALVHFKHDERDSAEKRYAIRGSLHKLGQDKALDNESNWRERLCFVKGGKFLYESAKKKGEPELVAELAAIRDVVPVFDAGPPGFYVFRVEAGEASAGRASTFAAESAQERDRWITVLKRPHDSVPASEK